MTGRRRYSAEEKGAAVRLVRETGRTSKDVGNELGINARTLARWVRDDVIERRLVGGELPEYPVFIVDPVPVDTFLADWLLELRGDPARQPGRGLEPVEAEAQLAFWAAALRDHGADFLAGDLAVLDRLEQMIRDNARRQGPPEVAVWVPEDTDPEAATHTVARVQATTPDDVAVTIRRYRRRSSRG